MQTMPKTRRRPLWNLIVPATLALAAVAGAARAQDAPGSHDHDFVHRWPASWIEHFEEKESGEYELALGPLEKRGDEDVVAKGQTLLGKITRILYRVPETSVSASQMYFSYTATFQKAKVEPLLEARAATTRAPAGSAWVRKVYGDLGEALVDQLVTSTAPTQRRYYVGKVARADGDAYIVLLINQRADQEVRLQVDVIETRPQPSPS